MENTIKERCYKDVLNLLVKTPIPINIISDYLNKDNGFIGLQNFIFDNMKPELSEWSTAIGIIEAVDHLWECAVENGNINKI